jgi:hypothetical protein
MRFMRSLVPVDSPAVVSKPQTIPAVISMHRAHADRAATISGNLHRGTQALLLAAAVAAVFLGSLPAAFQEWPSYAHAVKHWTVPAEAMILSMVIIVWNLHFIATNHHRWSDCRRLAERLRCLCATWPLGFDVSDLKSDRPQTWTEWQARAILRTAGPPAGVLSAKRILAEVDGLRTDPDGLISGQAAYNLLTSKRLHVLHKRIASTEHWAFGVLLSALGLYVAGDWFHWEGLHALGGPLIVTSAVVPTLCAACLALDAKLGIEEAYGRSKQLATHFAELEGRARMVTSVADSCEVMREASHLLLKDVDAWQDAAVRRKIAAL